MYIKCSLVFRIIYSMINALCWCIIMWNNKCFYKSTVGRKSDDFHVVRETNYASLTVPVPNKTKNIKGNMKKILFWNDVSMIFHCKTLPYKFCFGMMLVWPFIVKPCIHYNFFLMMLVWPFDVKPYFIISVLDLY